MQPFFNVLSVIAFLACYFLYDIYVASLAVSVLSAAQMALDLIGALSMTGLERFSTWMLILCGLATWYFHDPIYLQWKVTVLHAIFATLFYGYYYLQGSSFFTHIMKSQALHLPDQIGKKADQLLGHFMISIACVNYLVFTNCSEQTWVYFKGSIFFLNLAYMLMLSFFLSQHVVKIEDEPLQTR
jgi:intracellular septation protein